MKKFVSLMLAAVMVFTLAACSGSEGSVQTQPDTAESSGADALISSDVQELKAHKIGILSHTNSGGCWERIYDAAGYVAKNLNCTTMKAVGSSADQILSEVENFIAAGCDGIICMNDGGVTSRLVSLCEESDVYIVFSDCGYAVSEDDDYSTYNTSPYYCGNVAHDEFADSYTCAEMMINNGAKHPVVFGLAPGISNNFDKRATGAEKAIQDAGLDVIEVRSNSLAQTAPTIMSQYPDTDAIFSFVTTTDSFNVDEFVKEYGTDIQISAYMSGDVTDAFEKGFLNYVSVGSEARIEMAFALLYNAMTGSRLADGNGVAPIIEYPHLWIDNTDDYKVFYSSVTGGNYAYSFDEVKEWLNIFGSSPSIEELQKTALAFSADGEGSWIEAHR